MSTECARTADVSAYLLGALPPDEMAALSEHLERCGECQRELTELEPGAAAMPLAVKPRTPPAELKTNLMATVRAEAELLRAAGPEADRAADPARSKRSWLPRLAPVAAGLAIAALAVAGVFGGSDEEPVKPKQIVAAVSLPLGSAEVEAFDNGVGKLILRGVPDPPPGRVYALWLTQPGKAPIPAGTVSRVSPDGTTVKDVDGNLRGKDSLLVTVETAPGVDAPTSKPIIEAQL
jgi:anti-sigma-K factor RskA